MPPTTPPTPTPPSPAPARSCGKALRRLNLGALVASVCIAYESSLGCSGWFSITAMLSGLAVLALILVLPIGWAVVAVGDFRGTRARDASWWAWLVVPGLAAAFLLGPMRDWPLALRLRVYRAELEALAAEARAMPRNGPQVSIRPNAGGLRFEHAWVRDEGVYLGLASSPDGEIGLFIADAGAPAPLPAAERPAFMPGGEWWTILRPVTVGTCRPIAGGWWLYHWSNP